MKLENISFDFIRLTLPSFPNIQRFIYGDILRILINGYLLTSKVSGQICGYKFKSDVIKPLRDKSWRKLRK